LLRPHDCMRDKISHNKLDIDGLCVLSVANHGGV
jgi:hypothetical protein